MSDSITLPNLPLKAALPDFAWSVNKKELKIQPIKATLAVYADLSKSGKADDLAASVSYATLTKLAQAHVKEDVAFKGGIRQVALELLQIVQEHSFPVFQHSFASSVSIKQPKCLMQADHVAITVSQPSRKPSDRSETFFISQFRVESIIGLHDFERLQKQPLFIDLEAQLVPKAEWHPDMVAKTINNHNDTCQPLLIETYLEQLAGACLANLPFVNVKIAVSKPFATKYADPPTLQVYRSRKADLLSPQLLPLSATRTIIMGIINLTPDSFGTPPSTLESSLREAETQVKAGVHILDLGGMSTAPNAAHVSEQTEVDRVVPFVKALRATDWGKGIPLSIDTFRARVAREALAAGANWINDVYAGTHDADGAMWKVAKETGAPIVLMHSRGNYKTMNALAKYDNVVQQVGAELLERVEEALAHGVPKWQIIVDPGFGFAKDAETNWQLMAGLQEWIQKGPLSEYPCLVGTSRKRFVGALVDQPDPFKRDMATTATCLEAIRAGAQIIRVHNPVFMMDAIKVADKLYRS